MPAEIVDPEREKPRNGSARPWTRPIHPACFAVKMPSESAGRVPDSKSRVGSFIWRRSTIPAIRMSRPAAARAGAISSRWLKSCSISAFAASWKSVFSMIFLRTSPTIPVKTVAQMTSTAKRLNALALEKQVSFQLFQKNAMTANMVPVCSMTRRSVICGDAGSRPISFSATTT